MYMVLQQGVIMFTCSFMAFLLTIHYSLKKLPFNFITYEILIVVDCYLVWTQTRYRLVLLSIIITPGGLLSTIFDCYRLL